MAPLILVTGANGYIASRLIPRLLQAEYRVRALAREPLRLTGRSWLSSIEVAEGSARDPAALGRALEGVHTAYYLIHNMASGRGYMEVEKESARRFAAAAERAGIQHIIYLGGLADPNAPNLAPHMRSRIETGEILRKGRVPVTEFRAGVIVGAGSISFEMIRFLTECFPIMPGPTWLHNQSQPIAATNVIDYLMAGLERSEARGGIYEMGGPDHMRYAETILRYARSRGLKRWLFMLPGVPISLMARFVDWLTPVPYPIATALVGGLQSDSVVLADTARRTFPEITLVPYDAALQIAMHDLRPARLERVWEGFGRDVVKMKHEGFLIDFRRLAVKAPPDTVYARLTHMGGRDGWPYANGLWRLRGWVDRLLSPRDARRSIAGDANAPEAAPRHNPYLAIGQRVDYYCVEAVEPGSMIRLHSELRAPGEGWMEWSVQPAAQGACLTQTAFFAPRGLAGFAYWFLLGPFHQLVFRGLIRSIQQRSESA
jgi:uncharacterized protein YbjT (DUF2867 family)